MFKDYTEVQTFFKNKEMKLGMDFGLSRMEKIIKTLGHPEKEFSSIHIAGSNGKGSTLNYLKEILMHAGVTVGSFTSPHIERLNERIMINDRQIADQEIVALMNRLVPALQACGEEDHITYFEVLTVLSMMYFADEKPEIVLFETGLGGRLDSTNVIHPLISIITNISLEHTDFLGDTIDKIAFEKAGIIKQDTPVITGDLAPDAYEVISKKAADCQAKMFSFNQDFEARGMSTENEIQIFSYAFAETEWTSLKISMLGEHQINNASLALAACVLLKEKGFMISEQAVRTGLEKAKWKGRIEVISHAPLVILDGAHNPDGMKVLVKTLSKTFPEKRFTFVMAVLKDKDYQEMLSIIEPAAAELVFTEIEMYRSLAAEELFSHSSHRAKKVCLNWQEAIDSSYIKLAQDEAVIITGSLYFIAEARGYLLEKAAGK
ncbi:dihydrofolate synthase/folylpolyglutamate synthase [Peribacillus deserti]|uniref:tetrahydrofolate synthase n=1 Tax=Peribacillus deserti TaxID=673318 RepID=A0ABS2QFL6_9BACI|nr:folylpolyglutamate synthase/dihydrofolate synthase family protein [Peribacillus deserti]MBM7691940.1 dihydrofolate synthase/folylpolyglutamate synthase [Peribacillus deserti]